MKIRFDRPVSTAARLSRRCGIFSGLLTVAALLGHRLAGLSAPNMAILLVTAVVAAGLTLVLATAGLRSLWVTGARGGIDCLVALVFAVPALVCGSFVAERYILFPKLYDVSTDISSAPEWLVTPAADQGWLPARKPVTAQDRELQTEAYPELTGRRYDGAIDRVLDAVKKVARLQGIHIVKSQGDAAPADDTPRAPMRPKQNGEAVPDAPELVAVPTPRPFDDDVAQLIRRADGVVLQGEARSLVLGLRFDVVIRLHEEAETTLVDIRVASRYGPHDLGFSKTIAEDYLKALDAELLGIAGS
ncbi:DUF1499 domain-containing protein [Oryzifoliimicrobium ureilyticus]|uniref:DUF1499 domain-containing protein n=1 Tax=Oryzifoliimicrobium ureilyticus TaxID=3113724 RepID=UPI003076853B